MTAPWPCAAAPALPYLVRGRVRVRMRLRLGLGLRLRPRLRLQLRVTSAPPLVDHPDQLCNTGEEDDASQVDDPLGRDPILLELRRAERLVHMVA